MKMDRKKQEEERKAEGEGCGEEEKVMRREGEAGGVGGQEENFLPQFQSCPDQIIGRHHLPNSEG